MALSSGGDWNAADQSMRTHPIVGANSGTIASIAILLLRIPVSCAQMLKPREEMNLDTAIGNPTGKVLHLDDYMWNYV